MQQTRNRSKSYKNTISKAEIRLKYKWFLKIKI